MELKKYYYEIVERFKKIGITERADIDWIFAFVLGVKRSCIFSIKELTESDKLKIENIVIQREQRKPLDKILGFSEFYGYKFLVNDEVLIPRSETEELVECALRFTFKGNTVLDIGTGSGAIAISIAKSLPVRVTAVDISNSALLVAKQNAKLNDVSVDFVLSNLFENIKDEKFDIIISNPPYIKTKDIEGLEEEVKSFEPLVALDGGESGLEFYNQIIKEAPVHLNKNGKVFFEVGAGQAEDVVAMLKENFTNITIKKDLEGIQRIVYAELKDL